MFTLAPAYETDVCDFLQGQKGWPILLKIDITFIKRDGLYY